MKSEMGENIIALNQFKFAVPDELRLREAKALAYMIANTLAVILEKFWKIEKMPEDLGQEIPFWFSTQERNGFQQSIMFWCNPCLLQAEFYNQTFKDTGDECLERKTVTSVIEYGSNNFRATPILSLQT